MKRLTIENLYFSYPKHHVLKGIDFCLEDAEIMGIVGPNGSGKSTLVKCIGALLRPCSGRVLLNGTDLKELNRRDMARQIGYVPQSGRQLFSTNVFDTVLMGRSPYYTWKNSEEDLDITADILTLMGLADLALKDFLHLSGGQRQKVLIARALAQNPKLLLLDEPTSALDIAHQLEVMDIISDIAAAKKIAVIMVMHDLNLTSRYMTKAAMLHHGVIYACGRPEKVFTIENIARVYGVEASIHINNGNRSIFPVKRIRDRDLTGRQHHCRADHGPSL